MYKYQSGKSDLHLGHLSHLKNHPMPKTMGREMTILFVSKDARTIIVLICVDMLLPYPSVGILNSINVKITAPCVVIQRWQRCLRGGKATGTIPPRVFFSSLSCDT